MFAKFYRVLILLLGFSMSLAAQDQEMADSVPQNPNEDFVTASLIVAEPGDALYSSVGHAALRMQCPQFNLDFIFSYEGIDFDEAPFDFYRGKCSMAMICEETDAYLEQYRQQGREVKSYELQLPIALKQKLWQVLDEEVQRGLRPYDYFARGCAKGCRDMLDRALQGTEVQFPSRDSFFRTRSEMVRDVAVERPWNRFLIPTILCVEEGRFGTLWENFILPTDLVKFWEQTTIEGHPIIAGQPEVLCPSTQDKSVSWCTPMLCAIVILALTLIGVFTRCRWLFIPAYLTQILLGLAVWFMVLFSSLPATEWSWLMVPFCPFLLLFWRWRKKWGGLYAGVLVVWFLLMMFCLHQVVLVAHYLLVLSLLFAYVVDIYQINVRIKV